jgi:acylphosphatase
MSDPICRRCFVQGRVQGVFFRASTARVAEGLGVTGHARNLADGRVEVLACGPPEAVDELCRWLRHGPPSARVDALECAEADCNVRQPAGFITG